VAICSKIVTTQVQGSKVPGSTFIGD